ncbi:MAG TPA: hypothetical protein VE650_00160 [Acetobacteraceae bacterium]|nr:hypothetical protein [Acetobacteraceae bacterium]
MSGKSSKRIDQFLLMHSARADQWRGIAIHAEDWSESKTGRATLETAIEAIAPADGFFAYPGPALFGALRERVAADDAAGALKLARRISNALLTRSYHDRPGEWDGAEDGVGSDVADVMPPALGEARAHRPYLEVLFVNSQPASRWPALADELRRLRRPEDQFVYEPVFVGSFEDAFCAAAVNPSIAAVVLAEGFPYRSRHDAPALRSILDPLGETDSRDASALRLSHALKRIRPELDLYLLSEREVEALAGNPAAENIRRIFYAVEEPLEVHLSILEGIAARYETPFFDNLKKYARRPIGTFHALPIARGKSVFKSDWIRDMGEFYQPVEEACFQAIGSG